MHLIYEAWKDVKIRRDSLHRRRRHEWESPRGPISIDPERATSSRRCSIGASKEVGEQLLNVEIDKIENVKDPVQGRG